ncbi:MAG TPA: hypothetical protein VK067_08550 [Pseudogracilibacillus sp.]|nr:hypothetical protein [Pseudogracilibacillus sp.]
MYSHEQLQGFIKGEINGNAYPYDTKNVDEVETYLKQLYYQIKRIPNIICEAEFEHYGSGYASFVEFFCYLKEDIVVIKDIEKHGILEHKKIGVLLNVSRLAPVFIYGEDERYEIVRTETKEIVSGGYSPLPGQTNIFKVNEKFDRVLHELFQVLKTFGYQALDEEYANASLPFQTTIPTIYREAYEYRVLDVLFYWED